MFESKKLFANLMSGIVAKKLAQSLKAIVKDLKEEQIDLSFFKGAATLRNIQLNESFCNEFLKMALPMFAFTSLTCSEIKIDVPWTKLGSEPIKIRLGVVKARLEEMEHIGPPPAPPETASKKNGSYGFASRIMDGIHINVEKIEVDIFLRGIAPLSQKFPRPSSLRLSLESISCFQSDNKLQPSTSIKKLKRTLTKQQTDNLKTPMFGSKANVVEDFLIYRKLVCEGFQVLVITEEGHKIPLVPYVPLDMKLILTKTAENVLRSVLVHFRMESVQIVLTEQHFSRILNLCCSFVYAFCRPFDPPDHPIVSLTLDHHISPTLMEDSSLSNEKSTSKVSVDSGEFNAEPLVDLKSSSFTEISFAIEHMTVILLKGQDTFTVAATGISACVVFEFLEELFHISPDAFKTIVSFVVQRIVLVGTRQVLCTDEIDQLKSPWNPPSLIFWPTLSHPFPLDNAETFLVFKMSSAYPSQLPDQLFSVKALVSSIKLVVDLEEWRQVLFMVLDAPTVAFIKSFVDALKELEDNSGTFDPFASLGCAVDLQIGLLRADITLPSESLCFTSKQLKFQMMPCLNQFLGNVLIPMDIPFTGHFHQISWDSFKLDEGDVVIGELFKLVLFQSSKGTGVRLEKLFGRIDSSLLESTKSHFVSHFTRYKEHVNDFAPKPVETSRNPFRLSLEEFRLDLNCLIDILQCDLKFRRDEEFIGFITDTFHLSLSDLRKDPIRSLKASGHLLSISASKLPQDISWRNFDCDFIQQFQGTNSRVLFRAGKHEDTFQWETASKSEVSNWLMENVKTVAVDFWTPKDDEVVRQRQLIERLERKLENFKVSAEMEKERMMKDKVEMSSMYQNVQMDLMDEIHKIKEENEKLKSMLRLDPMEKPVEPATE